MNKVAIYGGLGNQMFQYTFSKALHKAGNKTKISFYGYLYYKHHNGFDLARAFTLRLPFPLNFLKFVLQHFPFLYNNRLMTAIWRKCLPQYESDKKAYKEEKEFVFDNKVFSKKNSFFIGTWQSVQYFKNMESEIMASFIFKAPTDEKNVELAELIKKNNAVSLHVRRGDYQNTHWQNILGVIKGINYYTDAMAFIDKSVPYPKYFVFSDDMDWVKQNLIIPDAVYINHNSGKTAYVDMYLMSLCKHNIIANSTFSWWAAWLNKHENKIVIMPDKWMNNNSCEGIFPEKWIRMKV